MKKIETGAEVKRLLPAYPLFVKDPFFSVWSPSDELNGGDTIFWTGMRRRTFGVVNADGKSYAFMGLVPGAEKLEQKKVTLTAFSTEYEFGCEAFDLTVRFTSPLPPDDLTLLSCPVCYMDYEVAPKKKLGKVSVGLFVHEETCYDRHPMPVRGGVIELPQGECAWFGLKKQLVMSQAYDSSAAEWGYWYLTGDKAFMMSSEGFTSYIATGKPEFICDGESDKYISAFGEYENVNKVVKGKFAYAFDDTVSISYFGDWLKGYWFENGKTIYDAIAYSYAEYDAIMKKLDAFDRDLIKRTEKYGEDYLLVLYAGLRQSVGAHKLVLDKEGNVLFLSKENHSNGCIATVDVSYPSIPLYLIYNPELVKGMMRPIYKFNDMPVWTYDFAPHDVGTYPYCCGQIYGLNGRREERSKYVVDFTNHKTGNQFDTPYNYPPVYGFPASSDMYLMKYQMPVEECGNMLIMTAATYLADKDAAIMSENFDTLTTWVKYLVKYGLMPGDQLCTDDFAGHLDKNINLSVKAIVGIRAYAIIADALGKADVAAEYKKIAEDYAKEWKKMCVKEGARTPLVFDGADDTFSLKYNMAFDVMFGTGLFDEKTRETETDYYIENANEFGIPLDSRSAYTKSDWILWSATLTANIEKRKKIVAPVAEFLRKSASRVPFTDWYFTDSGLIRGFQNRTVQGGLFTLLLDDSGKMKLGK